MKHIPSIRGPLQPLPFPAECWQSVSVDFVFRFPEADYKYTGILVFDDRFGKMVHLDAVHKSIKSQSYARVYIDTILRFQGLPRELVYDRDPRFTA